MLFAGFNVSNGEYSLFAATAVGSLANLVGSWIAYWVGYAGRVDILEKHGKKLHIKKSHLEWADRWFERHGDATVFFSPHAADHPHVHLAAGGRGADAVLALHRADAGRLHPMGADADVHRQAGRRQLGGLEGQPPLRGLRGRRGDRRRGGLPVRPASPAQEGRRPRARVRSERAAAAPGAAAGTAPGPGRAAARVELGPPGARAATARLGLRRPARRRTQDVRGGAARGIGAGAGAGAARGDRSRPAPPGAHVPAAGA